MSCKSALYAGNTIDQVIPLGGDVNFGSVVRRFGNNIILSGGNVVLRGAGYYSIDVNLSITVADAGILTVAVYKDGVAIPGANASQTVAAGTYALTIPAIVRQACCNESTIVVEVIGVAGTVVDAAIAVEKL